jgi:hypothetical protein
MLLFINSLSKLNKFEELSFQVLDKYSLQYEQNDNNIQEPNVCPAQLGEHMV